MTTLGKLAPGDWFVFDDRGDPNHVWIKTTAVMYGPPSSLVVNLMNGNADYVSDEEVVLVGTEKERVRDPILEAAMVADPSYVPTVEEAARHPDEFVAGFTEFKL